MIGVLPSMFKYAWRFVTGPSFRDDLEGVFAEKRACPECPPGYDPEQWCDEHEGEFKQVLDEHGVKADE